MIIKMNNKNKDFYEYMGRAFGSRVIQNQTNDRIFDDDSKMWYIDIEDEKIISFISVSNNVIKNIYTTKDKSLQELLKMVKKENEIGSSTVTNLYESSYKKAGYKVEKNDSYKNFLIIPLDTKNLACKIIIQTQEPFFNHHSLERDTQ